MLKSDNEKYKKPMNSKLSKIIWINFILIFFVIGLFISGPSIIRMLYYTIIPEPTVSIRVPDEIRRGYPWYGVHEKELKYQIAGAGYKDFIVMQQRPFAGETINVDKNGVRYTKQPVIENSPNRYLFFGSSLIWGYGATDALTIPSIFGAINRAESQNYAVCSAGTRQLLAKLVSFYIENKIKRDKKNIILFNGGIMDALILWHLNKVELVTEYQDVIQEALAMPYPLSLPFLLQPASRLVQNIKSKFAPPPEAESKFDGAYGYAAEFSADTTVRAWLAATRLASTFGDYFFAVLPPVSVMGNPYLGHLSQKYPEEEKRFLRLVYNRIFEKVKAYPEIKFIDLVSIFDGKGPIYIDSYHYSPRGNQIYAEELAKQIQAVMP